jgi:NitT/TauT family transport system substrate-binding protein
MEGWKSYLANPAPGNELIKKANQNMTDEQLAYSVAKLKELEVITSGDAKRDGIGIIREARLKAGYDLLVEAKVIEASKVNFQSTFNTKIIQSVKVLP